MEKPPKKTLAIPRRVPPPPAVDMPCLRVLAGPEAGRLCRVGEDPLTIGRDPASGLHLEEPGVSWNHAVVRQTPDGVVVVEDLGSTNGTYVGDEAIQSRSLRDGELVQVGSCLLKFGFHALAEIELAVRLYESATRDHLTGVLNRGSFFERLDQEIALGMRQDMMFTLVMVDVDHFKRINDTYGHPAGDAVLRKMASLLRSSTRLEDVIGRYGGEEFAILLRNIAVEGALDMAERIRQEVERAEFPLGDEALEPLRLTVSLGVAAWDRSSSQESLLSQADQALYQAKESGRNRVVGG